MSIVLIPIAFLILVSTLKKIPLVGGNLTVAFTGAGLLSLWLGGAHEPAAWIAPWLKSMDSIAFIFFIIIFGAIFSALQIQSGAMGVVLNILRALWGKTPQGLVLATLVALYFGGSLMGTVAAVGAVIGILIVPAMDEMKIEPDLICAIVVTGASMGGMMPPVSNAIILACGLIGIDEHEALMISYLTVGIGLAVIAFFFCKVYIGNKYSLPEHLIPKETAWEIFSKNWVKLLPIFVLIVIVMLNSIPALKFNLPKYVLSLIPLGKTTLFAAVAKVPFVGKIVHNIVMAMLAAIVVNLIIDIKVLKTVGEKLRMQLKAVIEPEVILIATAFFLGAFQLGGQNAAIAAWAKGLNSSLLIVGGAAALLLAGMLTGGQSTAQGMLVPILAPAWTAIGITPLHIALASAHLAMAGQGFPPCDLNTFIIAGLVGAIIGRPVNPLRSMLYSAPYCIYLFIVGIIFLML